MCIWASLLALKYVYVWMRVHQCVSVCLCVCVLASQCAIVQQQPQGLLPHPPTHHNKEQLNAAALPAEEPTASHTSTNRQICLKPKGRSNKSQPTESKPLPSHSTDSNQRVAGRVHPISHYHCSGRITGRCAGLHAKLDQFDTMLMFSVYSSQRVGNKLYQQLRNTLNLVR